MNRVAPNTHACDGNFFEDFSFDQEWRHPTPRTVTSGDAALYIGLTGSRFAVNCSEPFSRGLGYRALPLDDLLCFHLVFGKSVADISRNAIATLGYADGCFGVPVYAGDTLEAASRVIGLKQNANGKTGTVYVRTIGRNQRGELVLDFVRWVMVAKRDPASPAPEPYVPELPDHVPLAALEAPTGIGAAGYDRAAAGGRSLWDDYAVGDRIDHGDGMTVEDSDHMTATRLYQNPARVHFDQGLAEAGRLGRRLVYGGHVLSIARALSFNGLANAFRIAAINGGRHAAPVSAGDTIYAWSEVLDKAALAGRGNLGVLRLRLVAVKNTPAADFPAKNEDGSDHPALVLDFDYSVLMARRAEIKTATAP